MPRVPAISESEWKVMKVLWTKSPQPAFDIITELAKTSDWHPSTVKTLLSRLHKKKAVRVTRYKNLYLYEPLVTEAECVRTESESFLQRFFGGSIKPLLAHFVQKDNNLSPGDLDELKKILRQKRR